MGCNKQCELLQFIAHSHILPSSSVPSKQSWFPSHTLSPRGMVWPFRQINDDEPCLHLEFKSHELRLNFSCHAIHKTYLKCCKIQFKLFLDATWETKYKLLSQDSPKLSVTIPTRCHFPWYNVTMAAPLWKQTLDKGLKPFTFSNCVKLSSCFKTCGIFDLDSLRGLFNRPLVPKIDRTSINSSIGFVDTPQGASTLVKGADAADLTKSHCSLELQKSGERKPKVSLSGWSALLKLPDAVLNPVIVKCSFQREVLLLSKTPSGRTSTHSGRTKEVYWMGFFRWTIT